MKGRSRPGQAAPTTVDSTTTAQSLAASSAERLRPVPRGELHSLARCAWRGLEVASAHMAAHERRREARWRKGVAA